MNYQEEENSMLKEYKKAKKIFKRPKAHVYFGFWQTPHWVLNIEQWLVKNLDKQETFKFKIFKFIDDIFGKHTNPCLPVWRRGNRFRIFTKHQYYDYKSDKKGYLWQQEFAEKLKKLHLSWLKPEYELPICLSCYFFSFDMMWKWKWDDVRYEFPPQITLCLFNVSFSIWWNSPKTENGDDTMYWETILNYNHKYLDSLKGKSVDTLSQILGLSDYCGYWTNIPNDGELEKITWTLQPNYLKNKEYARILKEHQDIKEKEIMETKEKLRCPKCKRIMHLVEDIVLTTDSPQYEYKCWNCGEVKYMFDKITDYYSF